jgi:hypothetical protein
MSFSISIAQCLRAVVHVIDEQLKNWLVQMSKCRLISTVPLVSWFALCSRWILRWWRKRVRVKRTFHINFMWRTSVISVQGWIWLKNKSWRTRLAYLKVEGWIWPLEQSWGTKSTNSLYVIIQERAGFKMIVYTFNDTRSGWHWLKKRLSNADWDALDIKWRRYQRLAGH